MDRSQIIFGDLLFSKQKKSNLFSSRNDFPSCLVSGKFGTNSRPGKELEIF